MQKQCKLKMPLNTPTRQRLERELEEAERKAHSNLARYKFHNFGYWAAIWVHLNRAGDFNRPNPFVDYVQLARKKGGEYDAKRKPERQAQEVSPAEE